jgi:hypothetical protein
MSGVEPGMGGYDTASRVQEVWPAASKYGHPQYWVRYFAPSPGDYLLEDAAVSECQAIWDSGGHYLSPISAPAQYNLSSTHSATGLADAQAFVSAMITAYHKVRPLLLPDNGILCCWLDQEYSTSLSLHYWNGWAGYINGYDFGGHGQVLHAGLYCSPDSPYPNCSTIGSASAHYCFGIWTPEDQACGHTLRNPPPYAPMTCGSLASTRVILWQFHEDIEYPGCHLTVNVDCNWSNLNFARHCFNVSSYS